MDLLILILVMPGIAFAYAMLLRPLLHNIPALKDAYDEADGFWAGVWATCGKSVTVIWGYLLAGVGTALSLIDPIAQLLGDPDLKGQITGYLSANPKALGIFAMVVSVVTIAARLRSIANN